jgi:hypothetical protein
MFVELSTDQARQYIDATAVFTALEHASTQAKHYAGAMFWREIKGRRYLIRTSPGGAQKSLGCETDDNVNLPERFNAQKLAAEQRLQSLKAELIKQQRLNKALRVGRCPPIVIDTLSEIASAGLAEHFLVVGTHAIYAYETAANVLCPSDAMATRDIDLLLDTRKQMKFVTQMKRLDSSFLNVLRKADKSFELRPDQLYTAVNNKGFEIDVIRRKAIEDDPHPLRPFEQIVVSTTGTMARMRTVHPMDFVRIKKDLAALPGRERQKFRKDELQATMVLHLVREHLPHLQDIQPQSGL